MKYTEAELKEIYNTVTHVDGELMVTYQGVTFIFTPVGEGYYEPADIV